MEDKKKILDQLRDDKNYFGAVGKKFLSNSDLYALLNNPDDFRKPKNAGNALIMGSYFHISILEPEKVQNFQIVDCSTRATNIYKEALAASNEDILLLKSEKDLLDKLIDKMLANKVCKHLIRGDGSENIIYETPGIKELSGEWWKGKADIINRNEGIIVDLKTTNDILKFKYSAKRYNYDSQAYIYSQIFGMDVVFCAADKKTGQLGVFECDEQFVEGGKYKVERGIEIYRKFYKNKSPEETKELLTNNLIHGHLF